jgi:methylmalonyl-CoA/ethylmalonyl-CoA epimerase
MDYLSTNKITKIGIIVKNIEEAVKYYSELFHIETPEICIPPEKQPVIEGGREPFICYRGERRETHVKSAMIPVEPIPLELIEPYDEPSPWMEFEKRHGQGVGFVSFYVDSLDETINMMAEKGMPAFYKQEKGNERYAYFESEQKTGIIIEVKEFDKK